MMSVLLQILPYAALVAPHADLVVAADGSGDFTTVQAAVESLPEARTERRIVLIKEGTYREKVRIDADCVTLRGASRRGTRIEYPLLHDDFLARPDELGRAVVNVDGDDVVLDNLTIENTATVVEKHAFAVYGEGDRTVVVNCDVLSIGADTLSNWNGASGRYYYAHCRVRGATDFVCPRGWCYMVDCSLEQTKRSASTWHDGSHGEDQKFVLRDCRFSGVPGHHLARHHVDAAFYFLNCTFPATMIDHPPRRVIYPIGDKPITPEDVALNEKYDRENRWGERAWFWRCRRAAGNYAWHADNLDQAPGRPRPQEITAAWTFGGSWDPESIAPPRVIRLEIAESQTEVEFAEPVTVRGEPSLRLAPGAIAKYQRGSGTETLTFAALGEGPSVDGVIWSLGGGAIVASQASARERAVVDGANVSDH